MNTDPSDKLSVVIPHGGHERLPLLGAVLASLAQAPEVAEVIVVELGAEPAARALAARWQARHLFIAHAGPFERARALNAGTALAREEFVAWHDNDLLHEPGFLRRAVAEMRERGLDFMVPYSEVRYLGADDSRAVRQGEVPPAQARPVNVISSLGSGPVWIGCVGLVRRAFVRQHGGLVEGFVGWGGEDDAWFHKARVAGHCGGTRQAGQVVYHLYHALSGGLAPGEPGAANPHYARNVELLQRVRRARSAADLARDFPVPPPAQGSLQLPPARPEGDVPASGLPVWTYWEGPCPTWVRACRRTMLRHLPNLRLLDPASFAALRRGDPDEGIDTGHLHVAHRADFIRAFLLQRFGGLWIDADCLVMQPLDEVLQLLRQHDFVAHRAREGVLSNAFIGARPGSRIAAAYYERVRKVVATRQRFSWNWLGGGLLTEMVRADPAGFHELPCERVQPVCWSRPQDFLALGSPQQHEAALVRDAWTYMLSNVELGKRFPDAGRGEDLLDERSFFMHLLGRSLGRQDLRASLAREAAAAAQAEVFRRHRCESVSGTGSSLQQTAGLRQRLPLLLQQLGVRSLLDAPCGDRHWTRHLRLPGIACFGADLLAEVSGAAAGEAPDGWRLLAADLLADPLPRVDAVLCRDLLVHLSYAEIGAVLRNFRRSGATWLLATTFTGERPNQDTAAGGWRPLNLQRPPFSFPPPLYLLVEGCTEDGGRFADKSLGVWRLDDLPAGIAAVQAEDTGALAASA